MVRTGKVLRFDDVRGYGFIVPDGGGEDVFLHVNDLLDDKRSVAPGTPVEFEVAQGERGLKAFAVRVREEERPPRQAAGGTENGPVTAGPAQPGEGGAPARRPEEDDGLCDVLSANEFVQELTEVLLVEAPELTGTQIVHLRRGLLTFAQKYGWVEG